MAFLAVPQPYDFERSTERFRAFGPDLANLWHDGGLHRVVAGRELRIGPAAGGVDVEPLDDQTRPVVRKLLGLDFELGPFYDWAAQRPILAALVRRLEGFRPPLAPDPFESLVTSITAQQVSMQSAFAIRNRMIERFAERTGRAYAFPMREPIARADIDFDALSGLEDDAIRSRLTAVRGLGPWSAEWFLARHLARPRAWPAGDLALRKAADVLYGLDVRELGRRLDPFQNLSAHYLLFGLRAAAAA